MKRLRVFLANLGKHTWVSPDSTPPLGILSLAAYLRGKLDADFMLVDQRVENATVESVVQRAADFGADVVGFSLMTYYAPMLGPVTEGVRKALPGAFQVLGGPHVSACQENALAGNEADAAVSGEGESTLEQIIQARQAGTDLSNIPGLLWRNGGGTIVRNPGSAPLIEDLDALPFLAYDLLDHSKYWKVQGHSHLPPRRYLSFFSSRGCPCKCTYCHAVFGKRFRAQSPERVVAEVEHHTKAFGITDVEFEDDIFNFDPRRVLKICELILKRNLKLRICFGNGVRTDALTEEVVEALVEAGLRFSAFALESGSPRIQKFMRKHLNIDKFLRGVKWATDRGVFAHGFAMLGFPTETEEDMQMTLDVACNSRLHTAAFFTVVPYEGTELYDYVAKHAPEKLNGSGYGNLEFIRNRINLSAAPDEVLFRYQRTGFRRFYLNPARLGRIVRDYPIPWYLPTFLPMFTVRATKRLFV
jgi:anaerobic magnesium-protoporphyrin IX monomethyl ester cyclase